MGRSGRLVDGIEIDGTRDDVQEHLRVELPLLDLDPLPEAVDVVIGQHRHALGLGDDVGRVVEHLGGDVDGRAGLCVTCLDRVTNRELARMERQQRRVDVEDAPGEVVEEDGMQDREEPGHGHDVDVRSLERSGHRPGETFPVSFVAHVLVVAVGVAVDDHVRDVGITGDLDASAVLVGEDEVDGDSGLDHGVEDRAAAGNQHGDLGLVHVSTPSADCVGWCELVLLVSLTD